MQIYSPDIYDEKFNLSNSFEKQPLKVFRNSQSLVRHMKKHRVVDTVNLMDSTFGDLPPVEMKEDGKEPVDDTFYPHWKPIIDLNLIHTTTAY